MNDLPSDPSPSDDLLRTLAAVPVSSSMLDLGCGMGRYTEPLLRLGFPVHACDPRPAAVETTRRRVQSLTDAETAERCVQVRSLDALGTLNESFDWIVADRAETYASSADELAAVLSTARRLLAPGGWLYLTVPLSAVENQECDDVPVTFEEETVERCRKEAGLAVAQETGRVEADDGPRLRMLYRRVDPETPA